jgi:nicotinamidase-related amidase
VAGHLEQRLEHRVAVSPFVRCRHVSFRQAADNVSYVKLVVVKRAQDRTAGGVVGAATAPRQNGCMTTALLLVDAQRNMLVGDEAAPSTSETRDVLSGLLDKARNARAVVVHVQNDGLGGSVDEPHTDGWELVFAPLDDEVVVRKDECDTFLSNPDLGAVLRDRVVDRVVVAGLQSEFCIDATSRGALGEGFAVVLPRGAHATYNSDVPAAEVSAGIETSLESEGVEVVDLAEVDFS